MPDEKHTSPSAEKEPESPHAASSSSSSPSLAAEQISEPEGDSDLYTFPPIESQKPIGAPARILTPVARPMAPKGRLFKRDMGDETPSDDSGSDSGTQSTDDEMYQELLKKYYTRKILGEIEGEKETAAAAAAAEEGQKQNDNENKGGDEDNTQQDPKTPPHQTDLPLVTPGAPKAGNRYGRGIVGCSPASKLDGGIVVPSGRERS